MFVANDDVSLLAYFGGDRVPQVIWVKQALEQHSLVA
jgi:hypothetical protein